MPRLGAKSGSKGRKREKKLGLEVLTRRRRKKKKEIGLIWLKVIARRRRGRRGEEEGDLVPRAIFSSYWTTIFLWSHFLFVVDHNLFVVEEPLSGL